VTFGETTEEVGVDFLAAPGAVLDARAARDKAEMMRKSSRERRLPASVLAKRRAAEKLKSLLHAELAKQEPDETSAATTSNVVVTEDSFEGKSDEEKAEFLAKQMSKLESSQILQILQSLETGALGKQLVYFHWFFLVRNKAGIVSVFLVEM
jgi:hypothetical protein